MKKQFYISAFVFLGIILGFIIHGLVEIFYVDLLLKDFSAYSLGLSWEQWFMIHHTGTFILMIGGAVFGLWQGKFWWRKIYGNKA